MSYEEQLLNISPREFEELVAAIFEAEGYDVSLTKATRDGGVDVFAERVNQLDLPDQWVIECKRYNPENPVGVDVVRQLSGVKYVLNSRNAVIVTTSRFTKDASKFAEKSGVDLVDRNKLLQWLKKYSPAKEKRTSPTKQFQSVFISHSHKDHDFVSRLNSALRRHGVRTWFAHDDLNVGTKIHESVFTAISSFDRLIVVLSKSSIQSPWVIAELRRAMRRQKDEKRNILFPVSLLSYDQLKDWSCFDSDSGIDIAVELRQYLMPVIEEPLDEDSFNEFVDSIVKGLLNNNDA